MLSSIVERMGATREVALTQNELAQLLSRGVSVSSFRSEDYWPVRALAEHGASLAAGERIADLGTPHANFAGACVVDYRKSYYLVIGYCRKFDSYGVARKGGVAIYRLGPRDSVDLALTSEVESMSVFDTLVAVQKNGAAPTPKPDPSPQAPSAPAAPPQTPPAPVEAPTPAPTPQSEPAPAQRVQASHVPPSASGGWHVASLVVGMKLSDRQYGTVSAEITLQRTDPVAESEAVSHIEVALSNLYRELTKHVEGR